MAEINISGKTTAGDDAPAANPRPGTPEAAAAAAARARAPQDARTKQLREELQMQDEAAAAERLAAKKAADKTQVNSKYLLRVQLASLSKEQSAREAFAKEEIAKAKTSADKTQTNSKYLLRMQLASLSKEQSAREDLAKEEKAKAKKSAADREADEKYLRGVRMTSMGWIEADREKAAKEEERAARAEAAQKQARLRGYAHLARTGALVLNSVHGDFEGAATGIGGGLGFILGGPVGAEIGAFAGEIVGKLTEAAAALPMAPGNLWNKYMSVSAPYFGLQRSASDLAGTGGFRAHDLMDAMQPPGSYDGPRWRKLTGMTQADAYAALKATGIAPQGLPDTLARANDIFTNRLTLGYRGLPQGQMEGLLGQGLGFGATSPGKEREYLNAFGDTLGKALPMDIDRSKLLARMTESIDQLVKGGAAGVSGGAVSDMYLQYMLAGGPGRGGEGAAASIAGTAAVLSDQAGNPATIYGYQQIAMKYGGLKTDEQIEAAAGPRAWKALQNNPQRGTLLRNIKAAGIDGSYILQRQYMDSIFAADPARYQNLTNDIISPNTPEYIRNVIAGNYGGQGTTGNMTGQAGRAAMGVPSVRGGIGEQDQETQNARIRMLNGTASDGDKARVLSKFGVPSDQLIPLLSAASQRGIDPMMLAVVAEHESHFNSMAFNTNVSKRDGRVTHDTGVMQLNDYWQRNNPDYDPLHPFDVAKGYLAGADNLIDRKGKPTFDLYNSGNPKGTAEFQSRYDQWTPDIPAENRARVGQEAAVARGSQTMAENFSGIMEKVTTVSDSAVVSLREFKDALDKATASVRDHGSVPPPSGDLASRLGTLAAGAFQGLKSALPPGMSVGGR